MFNVMMIFFVYKQDSIC